jgi:hypothetical protein
MDTDNKNNTFDIELLNEIPTEIDITKFASYRSREIEILKSDAYLVKEEKKKSLFQMLPRHMRRRTMGYIRKRLPKRIRHLAIIKPVCVNFLSK